MRLALLLPLLLSALSCGDETISGYTDRGAVFQLRELDGAHYPARATLSFPEEGQVAGEGPCNSFRASQSAPYPWFAPGPIAATRRACPDLEAESRFFAALSEMTLIEAQGDTVILTNEAGREMVFRRSQD